MAKPKDMASALTSGAIRTVTIEDAPAIHAIYAPYVANTVISFEATPPSVEEMAARIQKTLGKYPWLVYTVDAEADKEVDAEADAEADKEAARQNGGEPATLARQDSRLDSLIAGYVYASSHRERAAYQWSVDVSVYVSPHYQRRNIGRGLYVALFELLAAQGFVNAYAGIALPNAASVGIHEALGFMPIGVYRQVGYKLGSWHDVGWWGLRLAAPALEPMPPRPISEFFETPVWSAALARGLACIKARTSPVL